MRRWAVGAGALSLVVLGAMAPAAATGGATNGPDELYGTSGADRINGLRGNDSILGYGGRDTLTGGRGGDEIFGMAGADTITGGPGPDILVGSGGRDLIMDGTGADRVWGGPANDEIYTDPDGAVDRIRCGPGRDTVLYWGDPETIDVWVGCERIVNWAH